MQMPPEWEEIAEFSTMAAQLKEKYIERFGEVEIDLIIAYGCTNKDRPEKKAKLYEMSSLPEPESFTSTKQYFVKMYMSDWSAKEDNQKLVLVCSALERIDPANPGKVGALDYRDQNVMVRTFGVDWPDRDVPHLLKEDVEFRE